MSAATYLFLLAGWHPLGHQPAFPFPQLPTEAQCELCFQVCEADYFAIERKIELATGWTRRQMIERRSEAVRVKEAWYAAWWATWSRATPEQQDEWVNTLAGYVGLEDFWRGNLPLPLSLR